MRATRLHLLAMTVLAWMILTVGTNLARADEIPLVTDKHWTDSSDQMKKAYLVGIANLVQVEEAYHAGHAPSDSSSIVPRFSKGLKGHSIDSVRQGLDRWYAAHPDQLQRPVIETIWFEMILPGLSGNK
nr:hypothetical protein [uncultured Cupriavidus sp.]